MTALSLVGLSVAMPSSAWTERVKFKGDFRYRYEIIDQEGKDERHRNRIRLRIGFHAKVNETLDVEAMLASGGEDPVSTNQSLDSQGTTKDIRIDQAYFAWKPASGLKIKGGKLKNPFYRPVKSELLWDGDLRPEGLVLQYDSGFFVNAGFFYIEERSKDDESFLFGGQLGYKAKLGDGFKMTLGTGYFDYTEIKDRALTDFDYLEAEGDSFGNTLEDGHFVTDYNELEVFGDVTFKLGLPVSLFVDYVVNTAADDKVKDNDTGYLAGFKVGKAKEPGSWDFRYLYREIEADALFGAFSDSDFIGGGTDGKGHEFNFGYQIAKGWKFGVSYFINDKGLEQEKDFERVQVDLKFKF
ncbi:MAG: putative porin [Pseudomonadota bacterium]